MAPLSRDLVFISYAHEDSEWIDELLKRLSPKVDEGALKVWWDADIDVGDRWRPEIQSALERAAVGVLLVSPDYLASNFVKRYELPVLLDAADANLLTLVWVPIGRVFYTGRLLAYQGASNPEKPLKELKKRALERELHKVCEKVVRAAEKRIVAEIPTSLPQSEFHPNAHRQDASIAVESEDLRSLLFDYRQLEARLRTAGSLALIAHFHTLPGDPDAGIVAEALRLATHILGRSPDQLASQLTGRLLRVDRPEIRELLNGAQRFAERVWLRPLNVSLTPPGGALIRTLEGHAGRVTALAATPDGHLVVSGSDDHLVKVWDLESGEEVHTLVGHEGWVNAVVLTRDGRRVLSGSNDCTVRIWDLETGEELRQFKGHTSWIASVALTNDGRQVVSRSVDGTLKVWDLENGQSVFTLMAPADELETVSGWNYGAGLVWSRAPQLYEGTKAIALSANARWAASGSIDGKITVWDLERSEQKRGAKKVFTITGHPLPVNAVTITSDGEQIVSGSTDRTLKLWNVATAKEIRTLADHGGQVESLALVEGRRRIVSGAADRTLKVWDLDRGKEVRVSPRHPDPVASIVFTADVRKAVSASTDGTLMVWDLTRGEAIRTFSGQLRPSNVLAVTADARLAVSGLGDPTLVVWDLETGEEIRTLAGHLRAVRAVVSVTNGRMIVSGSADGTLRVWDVETGEEITTLARDLRWINTLAATADGRKVVSGMADGTLQIWDLKTGAKMRTLPRHSSSVETVAFTKDGRELISRSNDGELRVWNLETGEEIDRYEDQSDATRSEVLLPDLRWAASPSGGKLKVWDLASGITMATFHADAAIVCCAAAPDGLTLAAGDVGGMVHFLRIERPASEQHTLNAD